MNLIHLILGFLFSLKLYCFAVQLKDLSGPILKLDDSYDLNKNDGILPSVENKNYLKKLAERYLVHDNLNKTLLAFDYNPHFFFVSVSDNGETVLVKDSLTDENHHFDCPKSVMETIKNKKIIDLTFLKQNCVECNPQISSNEKQLRKLLSNETQISNSNQTESESESEDLETSSSSLCCFIFKLTTKSFGKNAFDEFNSSIIDDFLTSKNHTDSNGFDLIDNNDESHINFQIELKNKSDILNEIILALQQNDDSGITYTGFTNHSITNKDLINSLESTQNRINNMKKDIENSDKDDSDRNTAFRSLKERYLMETSNNFDFNIAKNISGIPIIKMSKVLTSRFIETKDKKLKAHFTPLKIKLLLFAIHEYLVLYSTIETYLQEIIDIVNENNGISRLYNFFKDHVYLENLKIVLEQYFGIYESNKFTHTYNDLIRFFINLNMDKLNPKTASNLFILKLEIASRIILQANIANNQTIIINDYLSDQKKSLFYNDVSSFEYMFKKFYLTENNSNVIDAINKIVLKNRNENPIDRPKECYKQIKRLLLDSDSETLRSEKTKLKIACSKIYGLVGVLSIK